jgi:E3 ubiquitin-protein ligase UHRF1
MWCLDPPLKSIPEDDWYCPDCKNDANEIFQAGELGNKFSHRKNKQPSRVNTGNKQYWGKGLATARRTKTCTVIPKNHFSSIPDIDVGMCWKFRIQVLEEGIHRPPVGSIAGRAQEGCQSIVLA